jgi:hypothetical protein
VFPATFPSHGDHGAKLRQALFSESIASCTAQTDHHDAASAAEGLPALGQGEPPNALIRAWTSD